MLRPTQQRFVQEYLIDLNATQAAIRAGYSAKTAQEQSSRLLSNVMVQAEIAKGQAKISEKTGVTPEWIVEELQKLSQADPREITELHIGCCRFCWGQGNLRQETANERNQRFNGWMAAKEKAKPDEPFPDFDEQGGIGYNATKRPNPDCPECFGQGRPITVIKDTRNLSPDAARLFAGIKQTRQGIEVKMHDPIKALELLGRHNGMFKDNVTVDLSQASADLLLETLKKL